MNRREERIKAILKAAEIIFLRDGFTNSSMENIAEFANLGKGTIYYYFKSKEEIFFVLIEREAKKVYEKIKKRISYDYSLYGIIVESLIFYFEYFSKNETFLRLFFPCIAGLVKIENKKLLERYTRSYRKHLQFIKKIITKKIKEENIPFNAETLLSLINVVQIGIGLKLLEGKEDEAKKSLKLFLKIFKKFLEG